MADTTLWYYQFFGQEMGPLPQAELARMISAGELQPDDLIREAGESGWMPVAHVRAFQGLEQESVQTGPTGWYWKSLGMEMGPLPREDLVRMLATGELSSDDEVREGTSGTWKQAGHVPALRVRSSEASRFSEVLETETPEVAEWYWQMLGQEFGPVAFKDLSQKVSEGEINGNDLVRRGPAGQWEQAKRVPGLISAAARTLTSATPPPPNRNRSEPVVAKPLQAPPRRPTPAAAPPTPAQPVQEAIDPLTYRNWYTYVGDQEYGPASLQELQGWVTSANLLATDYLKFGQDGEWMLAGEMRELFPNAPPAASQPAAQQYATPQYQEYQAPAAAQPAMPAPAAAPAYTHPAPATAVPMAPAAGGVSLAESERKELMSQVLALLQQQGVAVQNTPAATAETGWYCLIGGNQVGPMTIDTLMQMVLQKRLFGNDQIRLGTTGEWFEAKTVPELFPPESPSGVKKKTDDSLDVLSRVEKLYADAEKIRADEMQKQLTSGGGGNKPAANPSQKTEVSRSQLAGDVIKNMNASIARQSTVAPTRASASRSSSPRSSGPSLGDQLAGLFNGSPIGGIVVAVVILGALGYYFVPGMLTGLGDGSKYAELKSFQKELETAVKSKVDSSAWKAKEAKISGPAKDILRSLASRKDQPGRVLRTAANMSLTLSNELAGNSPEREKKLEFNLKTLNDSLKQAAKHYE